MDNPFDGYENRVEKGWLEEEVARLRKANQALNSVNEGFIETVDELRLTVFRLSKEKAELLERVRELEESLEEE